MRRMRSFLMFLALALFIPAAASDSDTQEPLSFEWNPEYEVLVVDDEVAVTYDLDLRTLDTHFCIFLMGGSFIPHGYEPEVELLDVMYVGTSQSLAKELEECPPKNHYFIHAETFFHSIRKQAVAKRAHEITCPGWPKECA